MKEAYEEMEEWAQEELEKGNRIKAAKIYRASQRMKLDHEREMLKRKAYMMGFY